MIYSNSSYDRSMNILDPYLVPFNMIDHSSQNLYIQADVVPVEEAMQLQDLDGGRAETRARATHGSQSCFKKVKEASLLIMATLKQ